MSSASNGGERPSSSHWLWDALALIWMGLIFYLSSQPQLPSAPGWWDLLFKKGGHLGGYLVLGTLYAQGWGRGRPPWQPWLAAVLYAVSDEVHQAFVPGRHPWVVDVLIDGTGAALGARYGRLWWKQVTRRIRKRYRPQGPVG